jgi:hypothetical protein
MQVVEGQSRKPSAPAVFFRVISEISQDISEISRGRSEISSAESVPAGAGREISQGPALRSRGPSVRSGVAGEISPDILLPVLNPPDMSRGRSLRSRDILRPAEYILLPAKLFSAPAGQTSGVVWRISLAGREFMLGAGAVHQNEVWN